MPPSEGKLPRSPFSQDTPPLFWAYSLSIVADWAGYIISEYRILGQETAELDFREFRWAKMERLRRGAKYSANTNRDEDLLEYNVGRDTAAPSAGFPS